jgi:hypothetical protein
MAEDSESRSVAEYCVSEMWRDMNIKGSRLWILKMGSVGHFPFNRPREKVSMTISTLGAALHDCPDAATWKCLLKKASDDLRTITWLGSRAFCHFLYHQCSQLKSKVSLAHGIAISYVRQLLIYCSTFTSNMQLKC